MSEQQAGTAVHTRWADVPEEPMSDFIGRQFVVGTGMMLARVLLKQGAHVPEHSHPNEQITYVLEGALRFRIDGREVVVGAGEVLCIPPDVPHEAWAEADTVDLDVFNPPRQDWIDRDDGYLRQQTGKNERSERGEVRVERGEGYGDAVGAVAADSPATGAGE